MERTGVRIDLAALDKAGREMEKELARLTAEIYKLAGEEFNINSPGQRGDIFEKLNFDVGRKTGEWITYAPDGTETRRKTFK
jgi:DNA polymerase-1